MKHQTKPSRIVFQACNNNNRRRRSLTPFGKETTDSATVSVGPLYVADEGKSQYRPQHCCSEPWWRSWLFHSLSFFSPSNKDRPFSAAYSEYFWLFMKCILMCLRISQQPKTWSLINPPPARATGSGAASEGDGVDMTGLAVGVVFGSAAAVLLVLGGWFILKKFYWVGGLPHAFDWQVDWQTDIKSDPVVIFQW